jgi:hypothetical protein
MAVLPTKSTVAPSDLVGQQNGNIDLALLTSIGLPLARLHHTVARGWTALAAAALEAGGWVLWWTSVADTYRTYAVQKAVFVDRYKPVTFTVYNSTPTAHRKLWQAAITLGFSSIYWIKKDFATATAATPGTSPHGTGCAIDGALKTTSGVVAWTQAVPWLIANARRFGFAWSLQSEPWHIQWVEGDVIPQAVLDFEKPPEPDPEPSPSERMIDMYRITYRLDRWPGAFEATVSADAVIHSQSANRGKIDTEAGVPVVPLDRQGIVDLLSDIGLRHLSYSATESGGQNPFSATYDNGNYHDTELELLWARRQSAE